MDIDMDEPNIVRSGHSTKITQDGEAFQIEFYRLKSDQQWSLEVVDREGKSHVWDDLFDDDHAALSEAVSALREDGATAFENPKMLFHFRGLQHEPPLMPLSGTTIPNVRSLATRRNRKERVIVDIIAPFGGEESIIKNANSLFFSFLHNGLLRI